MFLKEDGMPGQFTVASPAWPTGFFWVSKAKAVARIRYSPGGRSLTSRQVSQAPVSLNSSIVAVFSTGVVVTRIDATSWASRTARESTLARTRPDGGMTPPRRQRAG